MFPLFHTELVDAGSVEVLPFLAPRQAKGLASEKITSQAPFSGNCDWNESNAKDI